MSRKCGSADPRLALDSAISGLNKTKKDSKAAQMEMEVENAQARL